MNIRSDYRLPADKQAKLKRAARLEVWTIFFLLTIVAVMYFAMGSSQAMKTAWIEDVLSLIPPIVILISYRLRNKKPNRRFPYGYRRASTIAFLSAATALSIFGLYMLYESAMSLLKQEHPTIGLMELFGYHFWMGWLMIAALIYSIIPPVILGLMKLPLARELHDKALHTDAVMNKADWMTAVAGIGGILGIGFGFWWADGVAAGLIALDVVKDGIDNLRRAVADLANRRPTTVETNDPDPVVERSKERLESLSWVKAAEVRFREEGHVLSGEAFVVLSDESDVSEKLRQALEVVKSPEWRIYDFVIMPVTGLED